MKKIVFNIFTILLTCSLLITATYGWWISGSLGEGITIKSAKISSEIVLAKGEDFNFDGNLNLDGEGAEVFTDVVKTNKATEQVLVLDFDNFIPTQIHTWKITVTNKGDVKGYVYASLFEDIDFTDGVSEQENLLRFLSISIRTTNDDGSYSYSKVYLNGLTSNTVLFGGTDDHVVEVNESIELVFRIEFEMFDTLVENNICSEEDFDAYQALQGMKVSESFKFLDVSLSSHKPE